MGNSLTLEENQESLVNHPKFKHSEIHLDTDLIKTKVPVYDETELQDWIESIEKIKNFNHEFLFNAKSYSIVRKALCGPSCLLKITFQNYPYVFIDEINHRSTIHKHFEQNELWYFLFSLVSAEAQFLKANSFLGDIRPHNIFFNEDGLIKVAHYFSWPGEQTNFQKTKFEDIVTFLAPEQIEELSEGKVYHTKNSQKSESFSIGLSVLSALYLEDFSSLYNIQEYKFNEKKLVEKLQNIHKQEYYCEQTGDNQHYSRELLGIVRDLCEIKAEKRMSSLEVYKLLLPYEKQITKLKNFTLNIPEMQMKPAKLSIQLQSSVKQNYPLPSSHLNSTKRNQPKPQEKINSKTAENIIKIVIPPNGSYQRNESPRFKMKEISPQNGDQRVFTADKMLELKAKETTSRKVFPIMRVGEGANDGEFLDKIEKQLLKSRNMFPS